MKQALYVLLFGVILYFGIQQALEMDDSREWPTTEGVITRSLIVQHHPRGSEKHGYAHRREYEVRVEYSYDVAGIRYGGDHLCLRPNRYKGESSAKRELAKYPAGQKVKVHYDPERPERSVLELR